MRLLRGPAQLKQHSGSDRQCALGTPRLRAGVGAGAGDGGSGADIGFGPEADACLRERPTREAHKRGPQERHVHEMHNCEPSRIDLSMLLCIGPILALESAEVK